MIRGYHKYKVVWYNPLVGEDLLSKHEVGNPHNIHGVYVVSHGQTAFFHFCVVMGVILTPTQKRKKQSGLATRDYTM